MRELVGFFIYIKLFFCIILTMLSQGLIQVYTGNGKGKTTAAIGLSVRASGAGNAVLFYQFLKPASLDISERKAIKDSNLNITFDALEVEWDMFRSFMDSNIMKQTIEAIALELERITELAQKKIYDVIVLDEILFCESNGLIDVGLIKELIANRDSRVEIVLTGRGASDSIIEIADLVSEIKDIKHPYGSGIIARKGIEF